MSIDRNAVEDFAGTVCNEIVSFLRAESGFLASSEKLIERFTAAMSAWRIGALQNIRPITESVNELCIARKFLECEECSRISYEPTLDGTSQSIDFLVETTDGRRIFFDVKTVHPEPRDSWERFKRITDSGLLSDNTELVLDENWMGGEIAHSFLASREKFLEYTIELESKIHEMRDKEGLSFAMVFCGNGYDWHLDQLEDFADFYMSGRHRPDDPFAKMELHFIAEKGISLSRSIDSFCYLERKISNTTPRKFRCGVRGPISPF